MRILDVMAAGIPGLTARALAGALGPDIGATATGANSSANSYVLKSPITSFTAGGATTGCRIPGGLDVGDSFLIANYTGAALLLFPETGGKINNAATDASISLPDKDVILVTKIAPLVYAAPLSGIVNPNAPILPSATVAAAGSVQGDAAAIVTGFTLVTAANAVKGVILPAAAAGLMCWVKNGDAANAVLKVWPAGANNINALANSAAMSMAAKTAAVFVAYDANTWYTFSLLPS